MNTGPDVVRFTPASALRPPSAGLRSRVALAVGVAIAIGLLLLLEDLGGGLLNRLLLYLPGVDKALHVVQTGVLLVGLRWVVQRVAPGIRAATATLVAAALVIGLAAVDEVQQSFAGGRTVEIADIAASACGAMISAAWLQRRQLPVIASGTVIAVGLLGSAVITYDSWERLHDANYAMRMIDAGRFGEARLAYHRAIAAGHTSGGIYNGAAWAEIESGEGDAALAVDWAERALARYPGDADILDTYGWALFHAGRTPEAYARLTEALAKKPSIDSVHYHLATVLLALGRPGEARQHFERQITEWPRTREAERARARLAKRLP